MVLANFDRNRTQALQNIGGGIAYVALTLLVILPNREALGIGTLMNARGLMEQIIINLGLQRGIISEGPFAVLVIWPWSRR